MKDILSLIVDTEKEINEALRKQRQRLEEWVKQEKKKIDSLLADKKAGLEKEAIRLADSIKKKVEEEAHSLISEAKESACRIEALDEDRLKEIVSKYLERIIR